MSHGAVQGGARQLWREQGKAQAVRLKLWVAGQCHHANIHTAMGSTGGRQLIIVPGIAVASGAKKWSCLAWDVWGWRYGHSPLAAVLLSLYNYFRGILKYKFNSCSTE